MVGWRNARIAGGLILAAIAPPVWAQTVPAPTEAVAPLMGAVDGFVVLSVDVSAEGWVIAVAVIESSGETAVDLQAMQRILTMRFHPARDETDTPVAAGARITLAVFGPQTAHDDVVLFDDVEDVVVIGTAEVQVGEQVVTLDDIRYLPGSGGDVVRAVQNLPGVARPPFNLGQLLVRGTAPEDSTYMLDGLRIPIVFHFGGLSTVINGDFLDDVRFLAGAYGVRYGRALGGVVDLRTQSRLPDDNRAYASIDLFQATAFGQVRLGRTAITASVRRSYIDVLLNPILENRLDQAVQAPRFWDGQFRVLHDPVGPERLDVLLLVSDDAFLVYGSSPTTTLSETPDPGRADLALGIDFIRGRLRYTRDGGGPWHGEVTLQAGPESQRLEVAPDGLALEQGVVVGGRAEIERTRGDGPLQLLVGVEARVESSRWAFDVPTFGTPDQGSALALTGSAYGELTSVLGAIEIVSGVRADVRWTDGPTEARSLDPRTVVRWHVSPSTDLEVAAGSYSQFPTLREVDPITSRSLRPERSVDLSLGARRRLTATTDLRATAYHKQLGQLVQGRENAFAFFTTPPRPGPVDADAWTNRGRGWVSGFELQLRARTDRTVGWVAATFSRSRRIAEPGAAPVPFDYDQPVNLVALASHQVGRGWRLGGRVRLATGTPYTPVVRSNFLSLEERVLVPVYGPQNSARLAPYFAVDLRVDKQFTFPGWALSTYLDVTNVTSRANEELITFSADLKERPIRGLPIVPAFGLRVDL